MNNHNFFDYLLVMSLRIKTYKLVGRNYLMRLLDQGNDDCYCDCFTHCKYIKEIMLMHLFRLPLRNIVMKLLMRKKKVKIHLLYFSIYLQ